MKGNILNWKEGRKKISELKRLRKTTVFLSGVFDLLHVGHVEYLRRAKKIGDYLFVGVEPDERVRINKGENRPFNKLKDRTKIISELRSVDFVIKMPFVRPGPNQNELYARRFNKLGPNIVVIWSKNSYFPIWKKQIRNANLKFKSIRYIYPKSTTKLAQMIGIE